MSSLIQIKNTAISGSIPSNLSPGELAINVTDGRLFYGSGSANFVKEFTGSASGGSGGTINTGSLLTTASFNAWTGSSTSQFAGTASFALTSSRAISASYALNGGVTQLLAGPNVTLSPTNGLGQVTVSATLSGSTIFNTATGSYGSFYDTTTQTNPVANIPRSMSLNTTDITNGVSVSGSTNPFNTYIKTVNAGVYNIQFSAQVEKTDSGTDEIVIWLRKNGTDLTDTATTITLSGNNAKQVAAWNWFVTSAANDYYQIIWVSADTGMRLLAETISATHPGIPSVIVTANRVDQFLSNTGSFSGSFTGQFTGSFSGSGANLNSIPTTAIVGNFTQIATGSVTASVTPTQFTVVSGSMTELVVTGTGVTLGGAITDTHRVTGSLNIIGSTNITGPLTSSLDATINSIRVGRGGGNNVANVVIGNAAMPTANASTTNTVAIGQNALTTMGTAAAYNNNTAVGGSSLGSCNQGTNNTGIGSSALFRLQFSSDNVAIGVNAGSSTNAAGLNQGPASSIYIGNNTTSLANNNSNQIVIGHATQGLGTNTVVLGNNSIVTTALKGNVGIGTTTLTSRLQVRGSGATSATTAFLVQNSTPSTLFSILDNGNVGIGTAAPSASLHISGSSSNILLEIDSPATNNILFVSGSGRVGIGTSNPSTTLDISGSARITNGLTVTGSLIINPTGSFVLPLSQSATPQTGSAYWSGSLMFIYNGTRYMSASFF
jgi:hypothetical protein